MSNPLLQIYISRNPFTSERRLCIMASTVTAFACLLCSYSSDRKSNLESHVKTIHEKVKVSM